MTEQASCWIVDDDEAIRFVLERALTRAGYRVTTFSTVRAVQDALLDSQPDVLITDIRLPDADGLSVLRGAGNARRDFPVIAITGFSDLDQAVSAFKLGVFDYLPKPFDLDQVLSVVASAVAGGEPADPAAQKTSQGRMIGESQAMQEVFRTIGRLSLSSISVLITGETGSGKEVVARALHQHSPRADGPFIAINTAAIPAELLESELFGHERGSFTGAHAMRRGRFEEAAGGTLFLDEIGDMPLSLQTRLLRVLADGDFYRVGGRDLLKADVRVIAATHQDLEKRIFKGGFREDLFHRLNVIGIHLPPLRERREDILPLANHFLAQVSKELGLEEKRLRNETIELLKAHDWPGNIRQLQNLCRQLCVMAPGEQVFPDDLPAEFRKATPRRGRRSWVEALRDWTQAALDEQRPGLMHAARAELETVMFDTALQHTGGKRVEAARLLGVGRNTLARKLKESPPGK